VPIAPNGFVAIPPAAAGGPTGQVNNGNASSFLLTNGDGGSARFIFANLNGAISGWDGGATSVIQATTTGAVYTGLAINTAMDYLYAANSAGTGSIDVFDSTFTRATLPGAFANPFPGLVPFNVQNVGGKIYVTYALPGLAAMRSATEGNGGVAVFDDNGVLLQTLITDSKLASPWGIAQAPSTGFGPFSGDLLVGNFSFVASEINAFDPVTGAFEGTIPIDDGGQHGGLWALNFGIGGQNGNPNTLFFTDGIGGEMHGLFAAITFVPEPSSLALLGVAFAFFGVRRTRARG